MTFILSSCNRLSNENKELRQQNDALESKLLDKLVMSLDTRCNSNSNSIHVGGTLRIESY